MALTLIVLVLLIFAVPMTIVFDGLAIQGIIALFAAVAVANLAIRIRSGEASFLSGVIRPVAAVAAIPAIWMLIQVMPLRGVWLVHPIWKSAMAALGQPLTGSISVDPGATLISFVRYLSAIAIAFTAAAVAIDRRRAELVLLALMATATLMASMALAINFDAFTFLRSGAGGQSGVVTTAVAGLGVMFATVVAFQVSERSKMRQLDQATSNSWPINVACLSALAICSLAVITGATSQAYFSVVCGIATIAVAVIIRRFNLGIWGIAAIISITLFVAVGVTVFQLSGRTVGMTLAFSTQAPAPLIAVTQRILTETGLGGTGAGTFAAVLPIYQNIDELTTGLIAPTAAASVAVEMGQPFLWAVLVGLTALVVILLRGALRRRRDSFYATAGASCVVTITMLSFGDYAPLSTPVMIVTSAVIGLAIAQSESRLI